jgi:DNA gyrase/topoisomerase IV subunit B
MSDVSTPDQLDLIADLIRALVLYSLAEFQSGHATTIRVSAEGASFSVADDGRGHAIDRTVAGSPYLKFVYMHLDYPFDTMQGSPVQLHGIGMSLVNALCSSMDVTSRKPGATLRMKFRNGQLSGEELIDVGSEVTGNAVSGTVHAQLQKRGADMTRIRWWLRSVLAASPALKLYFNGQELHARSSSDA